MDGLQVCETLAKGIANEGVSLDKLALSIGKAIAELKKLEDRARRVEFERKIPVEEKPDPNAQPGPKSGATPGKNP